MVELKNGLDTVASSINAVCEGTPAWKIVLTSVTTTVGLIWTTNFIFQDKSVYERCKSFFFRTVRKVPVIRRKIEAEIEKVSTMLTKNMNDHVNNEPYIKELPQSGWDHQKVVEEVKRYSKLGHFKWETGCASGTVYSGDPALTRLMTEVYAQYMWTNPLHFDIFPGVRKMEAEVVRMCCNLFHGDAESCGSMTAGGTESIVLACKVYVNLAKKVKGIKNPEMLVPVTAHAAFDKGAALLGVPVKHVPVDPKTFKVDVKKMEKMITRRTCMIVGSSPQFPHGVLDPIQELSELALKYKVPLHVDACLGGFLVPFMEEAGYPLPLFDFRLPGVTSISCDTHKYGYSPKGSSVILYRNKELRHHQFFVTTEWPGGIYATSTIGGSRPGGIIANTWAALLYHGKEGYVELTRDIIKTAKQIEAGCRSIPGLIVLGQPQVSVVAFTSEKFNIFMMSSRLIKKGWNLNPLQFPSAIHIAVTVLHTKEGVAKRFLDDVREIAEDLMKHPDEKADGMAVMYGTAQTIPDRSLVGEIGCIFLDSTLRTDSCLKTSSSNGFIN